MAEVGIDLSGHTSDHVDRCVGEDFDLVITVCDSARENCPGAKRVIHHTFEDPDRPGVSEAELTEVFRRAKDEIGAFSRGLLAEELAGAAAPPRQP